jgi:hypothetical protein
MIQPTGLPCRVMRMRRPREASSMQSEKLLRTRATGTGKLFELIAAMQSKSGASRHAWTAPARSV